MYETIAAWSSLGLNVVVDVGHHDVYSVPRAILPDCARRLSGLPVLFVGVRCPIDVVIERRHATWGDGAIGGGPIPALREGDGGSEPMLSESDGRSVPSPVRLWQDAVHTPGIYDLEVDTSVLSPEECAGVIRARLDAGQPPSAFRRLADTASV
jgi:chloramphenicol 3-O phosphotransferase